MTPEKNLVSVKDAALFLECSEEHVRRLRRLGKIPARKIGKKVVFENADLIRYRGRGDERQLRLAVQWLAAVRRDTSRHELETLLTDTFFLSGPDAHELVSRWQADSGGGS